MTTFIDTNILLYSIDYRPQSQRHRAIAGELLERPCVLSVQVLNEFVWQSTRTRWGWRLTFEEAMELVDVWRRHQIQQLDVALFDSARSVAGRTNYSWWDCLIIAAAITAGCDTLGTEDMQHGHVIDGVRIVNPFRDVG